MWKKYSSPLIGLILLLASASTSFASGFALIEQSVSGLGNAFAGGSASAEDATTVFFNPAGMTLLDGQQMIAGIHIIMPSTKFSLSSAPTNVSGAPIRNGSGTPISTGPSGGDGGVTGIAPNLYYTHKLNDRLTAGLGINAPFGLSTDYDSQWAGRYHAKESEVKTININPAIAYKATDKLSMGAGINVQYIEATLSSMVDGGLVNGSLALAGSPLASLAMAADPTNLSNPANDILVENNGDDWSFGYNLGLLYEFTPDTRIGFAYRSEVKHKLEGTVTSSIPSSVSHLAPLFQTQSINASITLPASASLSLYHRLSEKIAVMGDITWTEWSSFDKLIISFEGTGIAGNDYTLTTEAWDDSWRYSIGATYQANEKLALRTGVAYDETPISDAYRTPRIPGEDRFWVSFGCSYQFTEKLGLDAAYAHLFVSDSNMHKTAVANTEDESRGTVIGSFENSVDIASIQISYKF